jgi:hypothetical protein
MKKILMSAAAMLAGVSTFGAAFVWIEGEATSKTNLTSLNPWLKGDNAALLSGGDALSALNDPKEPLPKPAFVVWKFDAPEAGEYQVYFRHGWMGHVGQMRYRFIKIGADGNPVAKPGAEEGWVAFDADSQSLDRQPIGQYRTIEWSKQTPVTLEQGSYLLDLQVVGPGPAHVTDQLIWTLIDVICLSKEPFTPNGVAKPGEAPKSAPAGGAVGGSYL